jgi:hypothetical protein
LLSFQQRRWPGRVPPPAYADTYDELRYETRGSSARSTDDGRVNISVNYINRFLSTILTPDLRQDSQDVRQEGTAPPHDPSTLRGRSSSCPRCNIVVHVVGSRGHVQPFVAIGKVLRETYGRRVRLATHLQFKNFVREHDLEFFDLGGDPEQLMSYMVQNPSLRPGVRSIISGDVSARRRDVAEYIQGCWRSCYKADDGTSDGGDNSPEAVTKHFVADCMIANPPSLAHIHCAEKMGIPLYMKNTNEKVS